MVAHVMEEPELYYNISRWKPVHQRTKLLARSLVDEHLVRWCIAGKIAATRLDVFPRIGLSGRILIQTYRSKKRNKCTHWSNS